jgi:hypothetical protein
MKEKIITQIITLIRKAQDLALKIGIFNILQPGLVKEMIVAEILGHDVIVSKRDADACDKNNPNIKFEYLTCYEGGTGQLDRMFKSPSERREESLFRIKRNKKIYFVVFYKESPLKVKIIYEIESNVILRETEAQLDRSKNIISHVGFTEDWASKNGIVIYQGKNKSWNQKIKKEIIK